MEDFLKTRNYLRLFAAFRFLVFFAAFLLPFFAARFFFFAIEFIN